MLQRIAMLRRPAALAVSTRAFAAAAGSNVQEAAGEAVAAAVAEPKPKPAQQQPKKVETTWSSIVVGEIVRYRPHPSADRLNVCEVDVGDRENLLQIICGAPNVSEGARVPVAKIGSRLAITDGDSGDRKLLKIKKSKLRGELSQGMICSEAELGLADASDGIWVLDGAAPIGSPVREWSAIAARWAAVESQKAPVDEAQPATQEPGDDGDYRCHI